MPTLHLEVVHLSNSKLVIIVIINVMGIWVRVLLVFNLLSHGLVHAGHGLSLVFVITHNFVFCYEEFVLIVLISFNIYFFLITVALSPLVLYSFKNWVIFLLRRWKELSLVESLMRWYLIINNNQFSS